jgi:hypothetical protein
MRPRQREGPPPGQGNGPLDAVLLCRRQLTSTPPRHSQEISHRGAPHLRVVPAPRRLRRIAVRISASDGRAPYGRSRAFRLDERDIERLIDFALQLEARRA